VLAVPGDGPSKHLGLDVTSGGDEVLRAERVPGARDVLLDP